MRFKAIVIAATALAAALTLNSAGTAQPSATAASYDGEGRLLFPADYREWVYVTSGHGMSYAAVAANRPEPPFDNVFADRAAYRHFLATGTWPEGTVLVLEIRDGTSHGSILRGGAFQTGNLLGIEVHVKDTARSEERTVVATHNPADRGIYNNWRPAAEMRPLLEERMRQLLAPSDLQLRRRAAGTDDRPRGKLLFVPRGQHRYRPHLRPVLPDAAAGRARQGHAHARLPRAGSGRAGSRRPMRRLHG